MFHLGQKLFHDRQSLSNYDIKYSIFGNHKTYETIYFHFQFIITQDIKNCSVKSAIFYEMFRLERFGVGISFLITSHTPVIAVQVRALAYLENTSDLTID
jgi:hypothetical protein